MAVAWGVLVCVGDLMGLVALRSTGLGRSTANIVATDGDRVLLRAMADINWAASDRALVAVVAGAWLLCWKAGRGWRPLVVLTTSYLGAAAMALALKVLVGRPDPSRAGGGLSAAFPSAHALQAAAVYGAAAMLVASQTTRVLRVAGVVVLGGLSVALAVALMYVSGRWVSDVLGGAGLGGLWSAAVWLSSRDLPVASPGAGLTARLGQACGYH